ncbi:5-(carboxyamino)imidazole ribonucleotide synthase [Propionibacterium freudenreichii]|uniref:5-(carboxyamino)imidazole ribonucleotide synthase n=1 Tax=Propionibacterium freudenreichii TaxID=1744 RepID=UPI00254CE615|nr:5-(carboxyamino)imidazole ribonucleotide synthase [Propionibacterium freudenreichii]MDK9620646.1 5-(carboxyamino)imidazole ribonucleotide synthase [Propionibacterium freudenreichii]MDK9623586.1 5-(carboxyamino)imidazole ribonucleotide synthase [Propionibacterium freudenreichii]
MESVHTVGIIGGGQLARMMYESAIGLGLEVKLLAEGPDVSAAEVVHDVTVGDYTDPATVKAFARTVDVVTFDHEHVPTELLSELERDGVAVRPGPKALVYAQDKALMRMKLGDELGLPSPKWRICDDAAALAEFGNEIGWPIIAKESRGGYDGHGVWKLDGPGAASIPFTDSLAVSAGEQVQILAEEFVDFARELSVIAVRNPDGEAVAYPVSETVQANGICVETTTPAPMMSSDHEAEIQALALHIAKELDVVGVLAVELMERPGGEVVINELAMRPHNTGHWSIDGATTSQFENHLRAVAGLPLGWTEERQPWCTMRNVLGGARKDLLAALPAVLGDGGLKVQLYGKAWRQGRKLAHVTAYGADLEDVQERARAAAHYLMGDDDVMEDDGE